MNRSQLVVFLAKLFTFVRETLQNCGQRVEAIQHWCGGEKGESWCAFFVTMVLDIAFQGDSPIPRQGSCEEIHKLALERGWITNVPSLGDVFLYLHPDTGLAHHTGIVTGLNPLKAVAGNTTPDGTGSNGNGCYEHEITANTFVHYPRGE